jgi:hypothetical protein
MLRKLLATLGVIGATSAFAGPPYAPYAGEAPNIIYNLLFCDDPASFNAKAGTPATPWQKAIFSGSVNISAIKAIAADRSQEGRVRYLAFARLRELGEDVAPKTLLGVIVEVSLPGGLDTLAAFSEGGVRYVNQSGKLVVIEGTANFLPTVKGIFFAAGPVVARLGPWKNPRLAPPNHGNVRLTFLVSDGLFFGEGPMLQMQADAMAGPVIHRATQLLQDVVALGTK